MALTPKKKIEKKDFSISDLKTKMGLGSQTVAEKELAWIPFNEAFHDALGIPGVPRGYTTQFRGFSDVGKSTGIYETIAGAQKLGDLVVIFDTEGSFSWSHARDIGFKFEDVYGEDPNEPIDHVGDFMYLGNGDLLDLYENFDHSKSIMGTKPLRYIPVIEDIAKCMNDLLDQQAKGELDRNITFVWDSIGSISCYQSAISNTNNNQWNAGALGRSFESILNFRIPYSRREKSPHINTFVTVQKIWLQPNSIGEPTIMNKGGDGFKYGVRMVIHMGGKKVASAQKLSATSGGKTYQFGVQTKVECIKNHVNGIELKGSICSTPHGFVSPLKLEEYKKENKQYILNRLDSKFEDFEIVTSEELSEE
jgi:hypothetical protein